MGILDIENRSENWRTARYLSPLMGEGGRSLAARLTRRLCGGMDPRPSEVRIELYWKGMRDFLHKDKREERELAERYRILFPDLRERVETFCKFQPLRDKNYDARIEDEEGMKGLRNNLANTEIDIVLETPGHLFIGEAKHEMSFGANASLILVHQLIRQYVMAKVLIDLLGRKKEVVPFVVGDSTEGLKKNSQVSFMIQQDWMEAKNVPRVG